MIEHRLTPTNLVQYNEYYPFGLQTANSWTRENTIGNNFLANGGTELNTTTGLMDLHYRNYDPALGRMNQVDPMASKYASQTPYNYAFNAPTVMNDPMGDDPFFNREAWRGGQRNYVTYYSMPKDAGISSYGGGGSFRGGLTITIDWDQVTDGWHSLDFRTGAYSFMSTSDATSYGKEGLSQLLGLKSWKPNDDFGPRLEVSNFGNFRGIAKNGRKVIPYTNLDYKASQHQSSLTGTEDGANWNLYYASSAAGMYGFLRNNDGFWMGKKNQFYSKSLLYKDYWGSGGKYVKGISAYRASASLAASTSSKLNSLGRNIGLIGIGVSILDGIRDGEVTEGDILRLGISVFTVASPIGWAYGLADLSTQIITGTSITDNISNHVDKHLDVVNYSLWKH
jgi:RHS repeat-associated protein